jgi:hypothetical protein
MRCLPRRTRSAEIFPARYRAPTAVRRHRDSPLRLLGGVRRDGNEIVSCVSLRARNAHRRNGGAESERCRRSVRRRCLCFIRRVREQRAKKFLFERRFIRAVQVTREQSLRALQQCVVVDSHQASSRRCEIQKNKIASANARVRFRFESLPLRCFDVRHLDFGFFRSSLARRIRVADCGPSRTFLNLRL